MEKLLKLNSDKDFLKNQEYFEFMKLIEIDKLRFFSVACGPKQIFLIDSIDYFYGIYIFRQAKNELWVMGKCDRSQLPIGYFFKQFSNHLSKK